MKKTWKHLIAVSAAAAALAAAMAFPSLAAVAKVGEQEFDGLQAAVNAAGSESITKGSSVEVALLEDVTLTDGLKINPGEKVTIKCPDTDPKTITMKTLGFCTGAKDANISEVKFINCIIDETVSNNPGDSGATTNLFVNTNLTLDHVTWTLKSDGDQIGKHGIFLDAQTDLSIVNGTVLNISGFNSGGSCGLRQDDSDRTKDMKPDEILVSGNSKLLISDCGYNGILLDESIMTVSDHSEIQVTNCGQNGGVHGIQCHGTFNVEKNSSVFVNKNVGKSGGAFFNHLSIDSTSEMEVCGNKGANALRIGGNGLVESGGKLTVDHNEKVGLRVHRDSYYSGDVTIKAGAKVSACNNGKRGVDNYHKLYVEKGANFKVAENEDGGISNHNEMTLNDGEILNNKTVSNGGGILNNAFTTSKGVHMSPTLTVGSDVRICNNYAGAYGGGLYNAEEGTATLSKDVVLYNNHANTGADDIFNTAGQKIYFDTVGTGWNLDDCNHRIDGWYDDTEGAATRWNADDDRPEKRHIVLFAPGSCETGFQIKAAHGADIYEAIDYPIDKKANGEDEIGTVKRGDKISFTLTSRLPKLLSRYVVTASDATPANTKRKSRKVRVHSASAARKVSGSNAEDPDDEEEEKFTGKYQIPDSVTEIMIFHDEMNRYLQMTDGTIHVKAGRDLREVPDGYYEVKASDSNAFRVEIDLVKLFNTGIIDYQDLMEESPIEVSYDGIVKDNAIQGDELINEAWVNDGEHDEVSGEVLDEDIPATGGMGRGMFSCLGILLMGTAVLMAERQKSHRRS